MTSEEYEEYIESYMEQMQRRFEPNGIEPPIFQERPLHTGVMLYEAANGKAEDLCELMGLSGYVLSEGKLDEAYGFFMDLGIEIKTREEKPRWVA